MLAERGEGATIPDTCRKQAATSECPDAQWPVKTRPNPDATFFILAVLTMLLVEWLKDN